MMKISHVIRRSRAAILSPATVPSRVLISPTGIPSRPTVTSTLLSPLRLTTPTGISTLRSPLSPFSPAHSALPGYFLSRRGFSDSNGNTPADNTIIGMLAEARTLKYWLAGAGATLISIMMFVYSQLSGERNHRIIEKRFDDMNKVLDQLLIDISSSKAFLAYGEDLVELFSGLIKLITEQKVEHVSPQMVEELIEKLTLVSNVIAERDEVLADKIARKVAELQAEKSLWYRVFGWK